MANVVSTLYRRSRRLLGLRNSRTRRGNTGRLVETPAQLSLKPHAGFAVLLHTFRSGQALHLLACSLFPAVHFVQIIVQGHFHCSTSTSPSHASKRLQRFGLSSA